MQGTRKYVVNFFLEETWAHLLGEELFAEAHGPEEAVMLVVKRERHKLLGTSIARRVCAVAIDVGDVSRIAATWFILRDETIVLHDDGSQV